MNRTRISLYVALVLTAGLLLCAVLRPTPNNDDKRKVTLRLMMSYLQSLHYKPLPIDDSLSARVYKVFIKRLDFGKKFFTRDDIAQLKHFEYKIDDEIQEGSFEFFDVANSILNKRMAMDSMFVKEILAKPFDFTKVETLETDPDKAPWAKDTTDLKEEWRKYLKYEVLIRLSDALSIQEKAQEKKDTSVKVKTFAVLESESRDKVLKSNENMFREYAKVTDNDRLSNYLNTIANVYDPHTEYYAPAEKKNFDITMSGHLEGIGAQLQEKNNNITIIKLIPGGPAIKSGEIKEGDVITKVAQATGDPVDVEGMRLDKAIEMIRGKKGTQVKLTIKKVDNSIKVVTLVRDVIELQDTYAHDAVIDMDGKKIGYIRLPEFYTNFDGTGNRTCSEDMKQLLIELQKENVKGIVIDLRDNGGGSLQDVVKMIGLFVRPSGPTVQVHGRDRGTQVLTPPNSKDTNIVYRGPLVVLVNGYSASASEIFAAAIQDYHRGIIMGSTTFGKGTVQQFYNLDEYAPPADSALKPLGSIKITVSKFYRINGGSTQREGVTPDIPLPDAYESVYEKEKNSDYPINWDKISPASYMSWFYPPNISMLKADADNIVATDSTFALIKEEGDEFKKQKDNTIYSLNIDEYRKREKEHTDENKKFEAINKPRAGILVSNAEQQQQYNEGRQPQLTGTSNIAMIYATKGESVKMSSDSTESKSEQNRLKQMTKDPELFVAVHILDDIK